MTTTTTTTRTCKVVRTADGSLGVLTLTVRGEAADYYLEEQVDTTGAGRLFRLDRFQSQTRKEGQAEVYFVRTGGNGSCDCPDSLYRRPVAGCKHRASLRSLIAAGKL